MFLPFLFIKEDNFCDFLFLPWATKTLHEGVYYSRKELASNRINSSLKSQPPLIREAKKKMIELLPLKVDPFILMKE